MQSLFFQVMSTCKIQRLNLKLKMQSLSFQRSINVPTPLSRSSMMVCSCLNLNDMCLTTSTLKDRIIFTLLGRTVYSYHHSFYNMNVSLDDENEGKLLRRVVSKTENFQAAFNSFKLPEMQPLSFQVTSTCKIQRNLKLKMQSLPFQHSINILMMPLTSSRALSWSSMMVCSCLNLNDMRLTAFTLEDRIIFTLLERIVYSYHHSLYNMNVSLDDENEGEMLRRVVNKTENFQAAFDDFKLPEMQSLSFQATSTCKIQRLNLKLKMQSLSFQRSVNVPTALTSSRPSQALSRSSCLDLKDMRLTASKLEDRIVFALLERTVYSYHHSLYNMNVSLNHENEGEMLRRVVSKTENFQAAFNIFKLPEEVSFFRDNLLEEWSNPNATMGSPPLVLDTVATSLNMNNKLCSLYNICIFNSMELKVENDGRQDSALPCDVSCNQAIFKRVHLGKFLAEAKFQMSPDKFKEDVKAQNIQLLNDALVCHKHRDAAAKRYIDMANATGYKRQALVANVCLYLMLPFVKDMEKEYIVAKLS